MVSVTVKLEEVEQLLMLRVLDSYCSNAAQAPRLSLF